MLDALIKEACDNLKEDIVPRLRKEIKDGMQDIQEEMVAEAKRELVTYYEDLKGDMRKYVNMTQHLSQSEVKRQQNIDYLNMRNELNNIMENGTTIVDQECAQNILKSKLKITPDMLQQASDKKALTLLTQEFLRQNRLSSEMEVEIFNKNENNKK